MALIIPRSVGGTADEPETVEVASPIETRALNLVIPESVGGAKVAPAPAQSPVPMASTLPEIGDAPELNELSIPSFLASAGAMFTFDDSEVGDILKSQFPNTVITPDSEGSLVATFPSGESFAINKSGFSGQDLIKVLGSVAAFTPAARAAAIPATIAKKFGVGAAAGAGTQAAIESGQVGLGGEFDKSEVAIAAGLGGAAELVVPAIQGIRQSRQAAQFGANADELAQVAPAIDAVGDAVEATGVPLFQAQKTLVPSQLEKQSFIASLPAGTMKASRELKAQNKAAGEAVDNFLFSIAPPSSLITGPEKIRTAAQEAVSRVAAIRSEAASPIYKQAFRRQRKGQIGKIDTDKLQTKIFQMAKQFDPNDQISINLNKALDKITRARGNLQKLHTSKTEIDQIINGFGIDSVGKTTKRFLTGVQKDLVDEMIGQSPSYRAAKSEFERLSPAVEKIQSSIIGKISDTSDIQLKTVSTKLFNPGETNPTIVAQAKKAISEIDPDSWNEIIRVELERRLGSIKPADGETLQNIPAQLDMAVFGNDKQSKVLFQAMNPEQAKNLKYLQTVLGRARLGRPGGSQTSARDEIKRELAGGAITSINNFLKQGFKTLTLTGAEGVASNRRVSALAEIMYNPQWVPRMKKIRKLSSDSPASARAMTQLLDDAMADKKEAE